MTEEITDGIRALAEEERSAFGRGWETHRRGGELADNPFPRKSNELIIKLYRKMWEEGFLAFKQGEYYDPIQ